MANKVYKTALELDVIVNMNASLASATAQEMKVKKPDGDIVTWTATVHNTNYLKHTTASGDIDVAGIYYITPMLTFSTQIIPGETVELNVYDFFE